MVSLHGDVAVVGAYAHGAAYVFRYDGTNWVEEQKLTASGAGAAEHYGHSVSVEGDVVLVGAHFDDVAANSHQGSAFVFRYDGTSWNEEQQLVSSDGAADDQFGTSVAVSGGTAVVGAGLDDAGGMQDSGSAYVFRYDGATWVEEQKLTASDAAVLDRFGSAVAISGGLLVVGAPFDTVGPNAQAGTAYSFRYDGTTWSEEEHFVADDGAAVDVFGGSVALEGDTVIAGAGRHDHGIIQSGAAYLYKIDKGVPSELLASDSASGHHFGESVAIAGDAAIVGAPDANSGFGAAYVLRYDGTAWIEEQILTASDVVSGSQFGVSVAIDGDTAVVGGGGGNPAGSAYVFRYDGTAWIEEQILTAADGVAGNNFGLDVAVSGGAVLVGGNPLTGPGAWFGAAYVFRYDGSAWIQETRLLPADLPASGLSFGNSVSIDGDVAVVSNVRDSTNGSNSGAAYVFRYDGTSWVEETKLLASDGAANDLFGFAAVSGDTILAGGQNSGVGGAGYIFRYDGASWAEEAILQPTDGDAKGFPWLRVGLSGHTALIGASLSDTVYVFRYDGATWVERPKLTASHGGSPDEFGVTVAIAGDTAIVGARSHDDQGMASGAAFIYGVFPLGRAVPALPGLGAALLAFALLSAGIHAVRRG